jgi:hypothetical protein
MSDDKFLCHQSVHTDLIKRAKKQELLRIKNFILDEETNPARKDYPDVIRVTILLINDCLKELE